MKNQKSLKSYFKLSNVFIAIISLSSVNNIYAAGEAIGNFNVSNSNMNNIFGNGNFNNGTNSAMVGNENINFSNRMVVIGNNNEISAKNIQKAPVNSNNEITGNVSGNPSTSARDSNIVGSRNKLGSVENNILGNRNDISSDVAKYQNVIGNNNSLKSQHSQILGNGITTAEEAKKSIVIGGGEVVLNSDKTYSVDNPTSINGEQSISIGYGNMVNGNKNIVLGSNVTTVGNNNVVLGNDSSENSNTVSNGAVNKSIVNEATVGTITYSNFAGKSAKGVVSVGDKDKERRVTNVAAAEITDTSTDAINGSQLYMVMEKVDKNKNDIIATNQNITNLTTVVNGNTNEINSLKTDNEKNKNDIISTNQNITNLTTVVKGNTNEINSLKTDNEKNKNDIQEIGSRVEQYNINLNKRIDNLSINNNQYINQKFDNLDNKINKTQKELKGIGALSAAQNSLPQVYLPGKSMLAVGTGHYEGTSALAIGYSRNSDNAKHTIKFQTGINSNKKASFGAGYGYQW